MTRIRVLVEGSTELKFCKDKLAPYFGERGIALSACGIGSNPAKRSGVGPYGKLKDHVSRSLKEDKGLKVTTMIDFYGLPSSYPEFAAVTALSDVDQKITKIETAINSDIGDSRFKSYIQKHEFEALLFSELTVLAEVLGLSGAELQKFNSEYENLNPEEINDGFDTAPSKRLAALCLGYQKVLSADKFCKQVGLDVLRQKCPRFHNWVSMLESWA